MGTWLRIISDRSIAKLITKERGSQITLKEYGRNHQKSKLYVQQTDLLLLGIDVSKAKHVPGFGQTNQTISFKNNREGLQHFEQTKRDNIAKTKCRKVLIAMEPSDLYWYSLYHRLKKCGYGVCLANCQAVYE